MVNVIYISRVHWQSYSNDLAAICVKYDHLKQAEDLWGIALKMECSGVIGDKSSGIRTELQEVGRQVVHHAIVRVGFLTLVNPIGDPLQYQVRQALFFM